MVTLYNKVDSDLTDQSQHYRFIAMISPENAGLQHVKILRLSYDEGHTEVSTEAITVANMLIAIFPRNNLEASA